MKRGHIKREQIKKKKWREWKEFWGEKFLNRNKGIKTKETR